MKSAVFQTGIIDAGAHSVRLEIFEVSPGGGVRTLESLTRATRLGVDVFRTGFVSPETAGAFSAIMCDYAARLGEYGITRIRAFATSAVREARNRDLVVDRVRHDSGIELEIMESAAEIELIYLAVREKLKLSPFDDDFPVLTTVIGSGSLFVVLTRGDSLCFCEEIPLGTDRLSDLFGSGEGTLEQFSEELHAFDIPRRVAESADFPPSGKVHLVTLGAAPRLIFGVTRGAARMTPPEALAKMTAFRKIPVEELRSALGVPADNAAAAVCAAVMLECFLELFNCVSFTCLSITTREAAVAEMIRRGETPGGEPFRGELRSLCLAVGRKYGFDAAHGENVASTALRLFGELEGSFNFPRRSAMLLEVASLLHDIGRFVDTRNHNHHSFYLISATQLPGLSSEERRIAAFIAGTHRGDAEPLFSAAGLPPEHRATVLKLAAILRVADALDCGRRGRFRDPAMFKEGVVLELRGEGLDFHSEIRELELKGDLFSQVFGIKVRIQEV